MIAPARTAGAEALLVQVRDHERARAQEESCFLLSSGLTRDRLATWNVVEHPEISWADVAPYRLLLIGGAGSHSATEVHPFTEPLAKVTERWLAAGRPLFGSCWGLHFLVVLLGGEVVTDPERSEVGTCDVVLTPEGGGDSLLAGVPERFAAQLGHQDRVERLPPSMVELARSERCSSQIVRLGDQPVYGTQFHCELDEEGIRQRLEMYPHYCAAGAPSVPLGPSPWPPRLLRRFVERALTTSRRAAGLM